MVKCMVRMRYTYIVITCTKFGFHIVIGKKYLSIAYKFGYLLPMCMQVIQCRKLLFEMSHITYTEDADPPSKKPPKWKSCCAAILSQKVSSVVQFSQFL